MFRGNVLVLLLVICMAAAGLTAAPAVWAGAYEDFFEAIGRDDATAVRGLMLKGVNANSPDRSLGPALVYAAQSRASSVVKVLLDSPLTDVEAVNAAGENALMYAALLGDLDSARRLVGRGAQVNRTGWSALHYAASAGGVPMIEFLLEHSAYIDAASTNQTTPLMLAARQKQVSAARLLVERGADPSLRNDAGLTAADYFDMTGSPEQAVWMRTQAAKFTTRYGTREEPVPAPAR